MRKLYFIVLLIFLWSCRDSAPINYRVLNKQNSKYEKMIRINRYLNKQDIQKIQKFAENKHWKLQSDKRGYFYQILKQGEGTYAADNMQATIQYRLSLLDGMLCENTDSSGLRTFVIGKSSLCSGMDEAITKLKKGGEARFVFPPFLAFGLIGDEKCIPARAIVVYEVKLVELRN